MPANTGRDGEMGARQTRRDEGAQGPETEKLEGPGRLGPWQFSSLVQSPMSRAELPTLGPRLGVPLMAGTTATRRHLPSAQQRALHVREVPRSSENPVRQLISPPLPCL